MQSFSIISPRHQEATRYFRDRPFTRLRAALMVSSSFRDIIGESVAGSTRCELHSRPAESYCQLYRRTIRGCESQTRSDILLNLQLLLIVNELEMVVQVFLIAKLDNLMDFHRFVGQQNVARDPAELQDLIELPSQYSSLRLIKFPLSAVFQMSVRLKVSQF